MPTLRVPVGGNGHRSIQRPIQTRSDGRCPDVRKKISQSVSHKSEPHPLLIFESMQYELKRCLSDINGLDVAFHEDDFQLVLKKMRDFLVVEAGCQLPGLTKMKNEYTLFQGWMTGKKIHEGHTQEEAFDLPTTERLQEMSEWVRCGMPDKYRP